MSLAARALHLMVRAYQSIVSPHLVPSCRFFPSCSHFALMALERHGAWRGSRLIAMRLLRCHPFGRAGYDPVP